MEPQRYKETNKSFYQYMKKDQIKIFTSIIALENHFQIIPILQEINHFITIVIEADHQNKQIHEISLKIDIVDQKVKIISIDSRSNSIRREYSFDTSSHSNSRIRHYSNDRSRNSSYNRNRNYSNNRNRS